MSRERIKRNLLMQALKMFSPREINNSRFSKVELLNCWNLWFEDGSTHMEQLQDFIDDIINTREEEEI